MITPKLPDNEVLRLQRLQSYGVLDTLPEHEYDAIATLAAHVAGASIALISLIDEHRQWLKAKLGVAFTEGPRASSFCGHVVALSAPVIVSDTLLDERFADNPIVTGGPRVRFYAGVPLRTHEGFVLGTLCVADNKPRLLSATQLQMLELLATQVVDLLELRRRDLALVASANELQMFRRFFELNPNLFATAGSDLHFRELNPAWHATLGWTLDELRASPFLDFVHPDDLQKTIREASRLLTDSSKTVDFENRYRHKDGRWISLSWSTAVYGGVFYCSARDVTEYLRVQNERTEALHQAAQLSSRVRGILANASYGVIETDLHGTIREFNHAAEVLLGYAAAEVIGKISVKVFHDPEELGARARELELLNGDSVLLGFEALTAIASTGFADQRDWTYVRKDGVRIPVQVSITARRDDSGEIVGYIAISGDISERKDAEARLRESEVRSRSIIDSSADAVITIDGRGLIDHVNPAVEHLFGYTSAELIHQNVRTLMPPPDREHHDEYMANYSRTGQRKIIGRVREVSARRKDGSVFPAELSVAEFFIKGHQYFTGVIRDISERKRIQQLQAQFISTVSHELRTPLTSIRGALGLVGSGVVGELPPEAKELVEIASVNSDRLSRLINDILDIEKMQSGSMEFRFQSIDLAQCVASAVKANEAYASSHRVKMRLSLEGEHGEVLADPDRLTQVLTNLLSNAAKFSPPESTVEISISRRERNVRVSIQDHGTGIPLEFRSRIFERFAQADGSNTRAKGGTGLGLSISKTIIEKMYGTIGFETPASGGTVFYIELPYLAPIGEPSATPNTSKRILVCEDDPDVAVVLQNVFVTAGYLVDHAPTLERARRFLAQNQYSAVTLDLVLADGDGAVLIQDIRRDSRSKHTPVVVVAGSGGHLGESSFLLAGVLRKPIEIAQLLSVVKNAIALSSSSPRILHCEDDVNMRTIVRKSLPDNWHIEGVSTVREATDALMWSTFDVVLLDLLLPDGDGAEILPHVGAAQVVVFSAKDTAPELSDRVSAVLLKSRATVIDVRDKILNLVTTMDAQRASLTQVDTHPTQPEGTNRKS